MLSGRSRKSVTIGAISRGAAWSRLVSRRRNEFTQRTSGMRPMTLRMAMAMPTTRTPTMRPFRPGLCMKALATSR
jgi:hypothetical protein